MGYNGNITCVKLANVWHPRHNWVILDYGVGAPLALSVLCLAVSELQSINQHIPLEIFFFCDNYNTFC